MLSSVPSQTQYLDHPHWSQPPKNCIFEELHVLRSHILVVFSLSLCALGKEWKEGRHLLRTSPLWGLWPEMARSRFLSNPRKLCFCDYVRSSSRLQLFRVTSLASRNGCWWCHFNLLCVYLPKIYRCLRTVYILIDRDLDIGKRFNNLGLMQKFVDKIKLLVCMEIDYNSF